MEEQKRYKVYKDNRENSYICDTSKNVDYKTYQEFVGLLNQQDKRIKELEEENKECKHWENMFHKLSTEEDNAITKVNKSLSNPMALIDDYDKWADYTLEQIKQSQKQFAIEKLEKIKNYFDDSNDDKYNESEGWVITNRNVVEYVSKQIKELKDEFDMEENERFTVFGEHCIKDNSPDARCQLLDTYKTCVMLNEQDKENQQLKKQLADKEQDNLILYSMLYETLEKQGCENVASQIDQMTGFALDKQAEWFKGNRNCDELLKLLAEKDKEIAYMTKQAKKFNNEAQKYYEDAYCNDFQKQTKISFAVEQLEKLKVELHIIHTNGYLKAIDEEIDNQINGLKGEK